VCVVQVSGLLQRRLFAGKAAGKDEVKLDLVRFEFE
jgi:hypothetical protein